MYTPASARGPGEPRDQRVLEVLEDVAGEAFWNPSLPARTGLP